jgi:hypothetical protein
LTPIKLRRAKVLSASLEPFILFAGSDVCIAARAPIIRIKLNFNNNFKSNNLERTYAV